MGNRMGPLTVQSPVYIVQKFGELWSLTPEFIVMVWRPFMRQMGEIVETRSILETRIRQWMAGTAERICAKFTWKTCLVLHSMCLKDKVKGQGHQGQKTRSALRTPPWCGRNGTPSLQITPRKQQTRRFNAEWCLCQDACAGPGGLLLGSVTHF